MSSRPNTCGGWRLVALGLALAFGACDSVPEIPAEFRQPPPPPELLGTQHAGPKVITGVSGPARFVEPLHEGFNLKRAWDLVSFADGFYRAPANDGYTAVLAEIEKRLVEAGYGKQAGFELERIEVELQAKHWDAKERLPCQAWTPVSGKVELVGSDGARRALHTFSAPGDRDRTILPTYTPSASVEGPIALGLDTLQPLGVLVTDSAPSASILQRAKDLGAVAVVSSFLEPYNVDPFANGLEQDAIQFRVLPCGAPLPVWMISPRSFASIREALGKDAQVRIALESKVELAERKLVTLVARIVGRERPDECVVVASHVQEPGACDNASGVAGLCESAVSLAKLLQNGKFERPSRSIVYLWGDEMRQTTSFLDSTKLRTIAGLSADMIGESREKTGAIALLERMPDPAAVVALPPDQHTPWGKAEISGGSIRPNGVALIARCAILDVAAFEGGWQTGEHPYEGGSDHDKFIERGIPAALFWHFTDFTYHTSLDRLDMVDPSEMRRMGVSVQAAALALADPQPGDLDRYLRSLNEEENMRCRAADVAGESETVQAWHDWCRGTREWLRVECLRIPSTQR